MYMYEYVYIYIYMHTYPSDRTKLSRSQGSSEDLDGMCCETVRSGTDDMYMPTRAPAAQATPAQNDRCSGLYVPMCLLFWLKIKVWTTSVDSLALAHFTDKDGGSSTNRTLTITGRRLLSGTNPWMHG